VRDVMQSFSRDLILDRSLKLVGLQSPTACATRAGGDYDSNFENFDLFHAHSPGGHRTRRSRLFVAGEPARRCQALVSRMNLRGSLAGRPCRALSLSMYPRGSKS